MLMSRDLQIEPLEKKKKTCHWRLSSVLKVLNTFLYDPASYGYYSFSYINPFNYMVDSQ